MRLGLIIAGILIAICGFAAYNGSLHFTQEKEVARVGNLSASEEETRGVPQWMSLAAIAIGGVLILGGTTRKT
ncbi:MAG: hypothetical protein ISP90_12285 [Nevskia sp.]|nr:hypothetical protein [Nevskia sp.]